MGYRSTAVQSVGKFARVSARSCCKLYADHAALGTLGAAALVPLLQEERKARVMEIEAVGVSEALEQQRRLAIRRLAAAVDTALGSSTAEVPRVAVLMTGGPLALPGPGVLAPRWSGRRRPRPGTAQHPTAPPVPHTRCRPRRR